jgi:hypothetical protein
MINRHSSMFVPPETAFFHHLRRQGLLYKDCAPETLRSFVEYYLKTHAARLLSLEDVQGASELLLSGAETYVDVFMNLMGLLQKQAGKPRIGEKTPHHLRCASYLIEHLPEARFICMIRDGRAVVRSRLSHPRWDHNLITAALIWRSDARTLRSLVSGEHARRFHLVRYEDMINDPEPVLRGICSFLGERFENRMLQSGGECDVPTPYARYYQQPWMMRSTAPIDPSRANAWLAEYAPSELVLVENLMKYELSGFGYSCSAEGSIMWRMIFLKEYVRHFVRRGARKAQRTYLSVLRRAQPKEESVS